MAERSSTRKKKDHDFNVAAFRVVQEVAADSDNTLVVEEKPLNIEGKNPNAVALGRLGGLKGGKARAAKLTAEQRRDIAKKAAAARWGKAPLETDDGN